MWLICRFANGGAEIADIGEDQVINGPDRGQID